MNGSPWVSFCHRGLSDNGGSGGGWTAWAEKLPMRNVLLVGLLLAPATLVAQEKITLRAAPKPNQVIRFLITQDLLFDVVMEGGAARGPMKVDGQMVIGGVQKVGAPDREGRLTTQLTIDTVTMNLMMNGAAVGPPGLTEQFKGKAFTIIYDAQGKVIEVKSPEGLGGAADPKQLITSLTGAIPTGEFALGQSVTVPLSIPIPVPIPGTTGPTTIDTKVTSKLVGITRDGGDRIATLDQTTEGGTTVPMSSGAGTGTLEMRMTGSGKLELNVDKGFVRAGESNAKMDMSMLMQGMAMKLNGTIHIVMRGTSQPAP